MRPVALCCLVVSAVTLNAATDSTSFITVLLDFERPYSPISIQALRQELPDILVGTALKVDLRLKSELPGKPEFRSLVMFKMKGFCTMNALPLAALSDERGPLAMTYSVDGDLLPFGEIECDNVRQALQRSLGRGSPESHQTVFGRALARVMAHEMYHMLAKSTQHTNEGITKESLSGRELAEGSFKLSEKARVSMREAAQSGNVR